MIDDLELYKRYLKKREIIAIPRQWATVLEEHNLSNVEVCWVTLAMIKEFKSFLRLRYVSRNEDIEKQRFEIKNIAWLNFGYGEEVDDTEELQLVHHPESVFVRFQINQRKYLKNFICQENTSHRSKTRTS